MVRLDSNNKEGGMKPLSTRPSPFISVSLTQAVGVDLSVELVTSCMIIGSPTWGGGFAPQTNCCFYFILFWNLF